MSPSVVPNFSPMGIRIRVLWWILRNVRNEEVQCRRKKMKKLNQILFACISEMAGAIVFKFDM